MFEAMALGIMNILNPAMLPWVLIAVIVGLVVGILPGLGGVATLAMLLPLIYGLNPTFALTFLIALQASVSQGGVVTSILFGVPGESTSTASMLDGYPLTKQGHVGRALRRARALLVDPHRQARHYGLWFTGDFYDGDPGHIICGRPWPRFSD